MALVTTKEMFKKAYAGHYAIGAFNINNMETIQGIVEAGKETNSPLILQVSAGARKYANIKYLKKLVEAAVEDSLLPIALHYDHGNSFEACKNAIDDGFTSVMIDASNLSYKENIKVTSQVCNYAHDKGVVVEAKLGELVGLREDNTFYTDPSQVAEFVSKTGVDSLSVAIGTTHGAFKYNGTARLRFDILEEIEKRLPNFPIVLQGASSIIPEYVNTINSFGGHIPGAQGVPEELLRKAASMAVCKINMDSDLRLAFTAAIRKHIMENPEHFDPRQYLSPARDLIKQCVKHKIIYVLGCNGKA